MQEVLQIKDLLVLYIIIKIHINNLNSHIYLLKINQNKIYLIANHLNNNNILIRVLVIKCYNSSNNNNNCNNNNYFNNNSNNYNNNKKT